MRGLSPHTAACVVVTGACRRGGGGRAGGSVGVVLLMVVLMVVVRDHRRQWSSLRPGSPRQTAGRPAGAALEPTQTGQQVSNSGPDRWDT